MGATPRRAGKMGLRYRLLLGLGRFFGKHAGQSPGSLRPAIRYRHAGRTAGQSLPLTGRLARRQSGWLPDASWLDCRYAGKTGPGRVDRSRPGRTGAPITLCRTAGPSRLPEKRVLRIQGQCRKALRPRLSDGKPRLQGHPGSRRLQHPRLEWQRLLPERRLCLHRLHRARL